MTLVSMIKTPRILCLMLQLVTVRSIEEIRPVKIKIPLDIHFGHCKTIGVNGGKLYSGNKGVKAHMFYQGSPETYFPIKTPRMFMVVFCSSSRQFFNCTLFFNELS